MDEAYVPLSDKGGRQASPRRRGGAGVEAAVLGVKSHSSP